MSADAAQAEVVAALNRFADLVNGGDASALACFTDDPSIIEDLAPFNWRGPDAGGAWLAAMAANAEREGMTGIEMRFLPPTTVLVEGDRAYAVLPGDLTYSYPDAVRHVRGHVTFALQRVGPDWRIQAMAWAWLGEAA